jgi:hypothetical protein
LSTDEKRKLRFGILCTGTSFSAWEAECIHKVMASGHAEPVLLICDASPPVRPGFSLEKLAYKLYDERWVRPRLTSLRKVDMGAELSGLPRMDCTVRTDGKFSQYFASEDVARIRASELDFILRFGFNIIRGDILSAARYGVWSYHHDDERLYRGGPPCFWEIVHGDDKTGVILQRLTERLDGGIVLHRGFFGTCKASWVNNIDRAFFGASDFVARACAELRAGNTEKFTAEPTASTAPIYRAPSTAELARFMLKAAGALSQKLWELMFHAEVWNVGVLEQPCEEVVRTRNMAKESVRWFAPHAPGHFVADPFAYEENGEHVLLVEDYDHHGKGRISELTSALTAQKLELDSRLEPPYHLSYPYLFRENGELYCLPEMYQAKACGLWKRVGDEWVLAKNLLEGVPVVDPTLFKHDGRYWLLCTHQDDGAFGNLKLYGYYADSLEGEFRPHLLNPLKTDISSARPAGTVLELHGALYRPAQDCSHTYGGALVLQRITRLTPSEFEEVECARFAPFPDGPYPDGLHTLNPMGLRTLIDSKKFAFDALAFRKNWRRMHELFT